MIKQQTDMGTINISDDVFTALVGDAATSCFGVKGMAIRSVSDGLFHILKPEFMGKGVYVRYNDNSSISIDLHIIIDQGVNIPVLCSSIINEVRYKVSMGTGVPVDRVDVYIDSIINS